MKKALIATSIAALAFGSYMAIGSYEQFKNMKEDKRVMLFFMEKAFMDTVAIEPQLEPPHWQDGIAAMHGEKIYQAQCAACHGTKGWGDNPMFPRLKGQPYQYTINQVKSFASGHRNGANAIMMKEIAANLNEHDLYNVAIYLEHADLDIASMTAPIKGFKLPDSGQLQNATETFGEDSDYIKHPRSISVKGQVAVDNNTQLMWTRENQGGMRLSEAAMHCGDLSTGGYNDWRLPTIKELQTIADYKNSKPAADTNIFTGIPVMGPAGFWGTPVQPIDNNTNSGWHVGFPDGHVMGYSNDGYKNVFCTRSESGQYLIPQLSDNQNGTVTDDVTGLIWQQATTNNHTWEGALQQCNSLDLAGKKWRLPSYPELISVLDYTRTRPAIDTSIFTENDTTGFYWTSTSDVIDGTNSLGALFMAEPERNETAQESFKISNNRAWGVSVDEGGAWRFKKDSEYSVRCVADE